MRYRQLVLTIFAVTCLVAGLWGRAVLERSVASIAPPAMDYGGEPFAEEPERLNQIEAAGRKIAPLHLRMGPIQPGDWLDRHPEGEQTFEVYRRGSPCRPNDQLTTLYLQKWGDFDAAQSAVVDRVADLLGRFFGVPVKVLEPLSLDSLDESAFAKDGEGSAPRLFTDHVLGRLRSGPRRPNDVAAMLALTTLDLARNDEGGWAFGQASLVDRVAVASLFRHGDPNVDFTLCLRRTLKTCLHEVGHSFGIPHCAAYECGMNGSSHREEADRRPLWFCAEDEMKVWLACRLDPASRYERLIDFAQANGLGEEARFWTASRQALRGTNRHPAAR